ncbi:MAG: hypothetical protein ABSA58_09180 [Acetobacteraceae bacterium]
MIFTPHTLTGLLLGTDFGLTSFDLTTLACPLAGACALMVYGSRSGGSATACLLAGVTFLLGGVATSRLQHVTQMISYGTIPVILLALQFLCARPRPGRAFLLGLAGLAMVLNPNQVVFLSAFALTPFAIFHVSHSPYPSRAVLFIAAAGLTIAVAASPLYAAVAETIGLSTRGAMSLSKSGLASFPAYNLFSLFLPGLYGALSENSPLWAPTDITQDYLYIGTLPAAALLLALISFARLASPARIALVTMMGFAIYAMGVNTPVYPWLFHHIPGVAAFRRPADAAFMLNFLAAVALAGLSGKCIPVRPTIVGVCSVAAFVCAAVSLAPALRDAALASGQTAELTHVVQSFAIRAAVSGILVIAAWFLASRWPISHGPISHGPISRWSISRRPFAAAPLAVVLATWAAADMASAGRDVHYMAKVASLSFPEAYRHPASILAMNRGKPPIALEGTDPYRGGPWRMEAIGGAMGSSLPLLLEFANAQGYNPVKLQTYAAVFGAQQLQQEPKEFTPAAPGYDSAPYRWIGLRYVLLHHYIVEHPSQFGALGRATTRVRDTLIAISARRVDDLDDYEVWVLADSWPKASLVEVTDKDWPARPLSDGSCGVTLFRNGRISVECDAPRTARLVLSEAQAPGWRACVDGASAEIVAFGGVLRSVLVPRGVSTVQFHYEPVPFLRGTGCD